MSNDTTTDLGSRPVGGCKTEQRDWDGVTLGSRTVAATRRIDNGSNGTTPEEKTASVEASAALDADVLTTITQYGLGDAAWSITGTQLGASSDVPYAVAGGIVTILDASDLAAGTDVLTIQARETCIPFRISVFTLTITVSA